MTASAGVARARALPRIAVEGRLALRIALGLIAVAGATAVSVRLSGASAVRDWLGFTFPGIPQRLGAAASIFAANVRMLAGILAACVVVQAPYLAGDPGAARRGFHRAAIAGCDLVLLAVALWHAVLVGSGLGAYGGRMVVALLPHGPVELGSFALALSLYASARRERLPAGRWLAGAAASAAGLAVAALLESLVSV